MIHRREDLFMKISKVKNTNGKLTINARTAVVVADYGQEG